MFLNEGNMISPNGIYGINIYALGMPYTVIVDDYLPMLNIPGLDIQPLFANWASQGGAPLWGSLIEKAIAKLAGNYHHIEYGKAYQATSIMTGAPQ